MNKPTDSSLPHYLRVVRALALAAVATGCTSSSTEAPPMNMTIADAGGYDTPLVDAHDVDAGTDVDADLPFTSGPIVPPELPASLA